MPQKTRGQTYQINGISVPQCVRDYVFRFNWHDLELVLNPLVTPGELKQSLKIDSAHSLDSYTFMFKWDDLLLLLDPYIAPKRLESIFNQCSSRQHILQNATSLELMNTIKSNLSPRHHGLLRGSFT